jgi:tetratricopeptide (TPR) repeat protein
LFNRVRILIRNNMKKIIFTSLIALFAISCSNSAPTQIQTEKPISSNKEATTTVAAHTTENQPPANSSSGGSPNTKAVDVTKLTENIETLEKIVKKNSKDVKTNMELATVYFQRAFALTDAAQYSAALGDFRKGLKLNPNDKEAKGMHDKIVEIYESMGRPAPKEGEEKAPMPIEK